MHKWYYLLTLQMFACAACLAALPEWDSAPQHYLVNEATIVASSAGTSTGDEYLLTRQAYRSFIFSFEATRLPFEGPRPRAIVVWGVDKKDRQNRNSYFINALMPEVGKRHSFRIVVAGGRFKLYCDGKLRATSPAVYGKPPAEGGVGFLHYYNYAYRYENVDITSLAPHTLPIPSNVTAALSPSGCVKLTWQVPSSYADMLTFKVYRVAGQETPSAQRQPVATVDTLAYLDRTCRVRETYEYRVAASLGDDAGQPSDAAVVRVSNGMPPRPVKIVKALRRIDGSARIAWQLDPESRAAGVTVVAGRQPITPDNLRTARPLTKQLPLAQSEFLVPPIVEEFIAVLLEDPDGVSPAVTPVVVLPSVPPVAKGKAWPQRHPMLLYDWAQVARARQKIATESWARKARDKACAQADAIIKSPPRIPAEPVDSHPVPSRAQEVGQAYILSAHEKYARWVRDALVGYAEAYPKYPIHGAGRARMAKTGSGLYEAVKYIPLILAYDLTYDSPAYSEQDHQKIERDFLRPAVDLFWVKDYGSRHDYRAQDLHYKCYNFQAWFISAVGLTGLLLRDADMVEHAIDGPYGFKHLLAHDIHDDGVFWERSLGYHNFVISALYPFLEAAWHCNMDLWHLTVPDDFNEDREPLANYCVGDGDNGPKSLKLMFDSQFYACYGDLTYARIADSNRGPLRADRRYRTAWVRYRDQKYAWLINRGSSKDTTKKLYRGEQDASADIRLAYDAKALYLIASITDDVVTNTHKDAEKVWAGDALWFGIKWREEKGGPYDFIYGLSPGDFKDTPPVPALFNRFVTNVGARSSCQYAVKRTNVGYVIEAAFPLTEFVPKEGEKCQAFRPTDGARCTIDFVIYDCDDASKTSTKEKMVCWSCVTDRYDSSEGGTLVFGAAPDLKGKTVNAPRTSEPLRIDGDLSDWATLGATPARIGKNAAILTDAGARGPDIHALFYPQPGPDEGVFNLRGNSFCNNGVLKSGCSLFPSTGFAVLREGLDEDGMVPRDAACATLNCGPHGGGHGHSDKLSIVFYADGKHWFPDFGSCGYGSKEKASWTAQTISHNTITVDGVSQYPTGDRNVTWPCDSAAQQARSYIDFFHCDDLLKSAAAHCDSVYQGVRLRRTLALIGNVLFDFFEVRSNEEHLYDYALHIDGHMLKSSAPREHPVAEVAKTSVASPRDPNSGEFRYGPLVSQKGALGERAGYQHITEVASSEAVAPITMLFGDANRKLYLWIPGKAGTQILVGKSITSSIEHVMPMLVLRRRARDSVFATAAQALMEETPAQISWLPTKAEGVIAARIRAGENDILAVFNPTGGRASVDGYTCRGALGVRVKGRDGPVKSSEAPAFKTSR